MDWLPSYFVRLIGLSINTCVPLLALFFIETGAGTSAVFFLPVVFFGIVPILDFLIGERRLEIDNLENDPFFDVLLYLQAPLHLSIFIGAIHMAVTQDLPLWARIVAVAGFGLINGQCALIGHEFAHKTGRAKRIAAQMVLAVVGMGHFLLEHVRGHHIQVATPEDCASARLDESIYAFALRDMPGEVSGGLRREASRLALTGTRALSVHNRILQSYAVTALIAFALVIVLGPLVLPWIVLHHLFAWFTLTLVTYIEHYGLLRAMGANGRREPVQRVHTWNTDAMISNMLLLNVQRHSDHHARPMRPYQSLLDEAGGPRLPTGYFGMMVLAFVPPLWRRVMNPRTIAAVSGNCERLHILGPPSRNVARDIRLFTQDAATR
ncbi:MAG: alkane 1-monooxygenase [Sphingomonadales bacterium]|nr:alkane 1-monooxygenase [Sphingomonadales bacterium]